MLKPRRIEVFSKLFEKLKFLEICVLKVFQGKLKMRFAKCVPREEHDLDYFSAYSLFLLSTTWKLFNFFENSLISRPVKVGFIFFASEYFSDKKVQLKKNIYLERSIFTQSVRQYLNITRTTNTSLVEFVRK